MPTATLTNPRELRGLALLSKGSAIRQTNDKTYVVKSQNGSGEYQVWHDGINWNCECPDHQIRHVNCKHIFAVLFSRKLKVEVNERNIEDNTVPKVVLLCPKCGENDIIKSGMRKAKRGTIQRYQCRPCGFRFVIDTGFCRMKSEPKAIVVVMDLYFKGVSLRKITNHLKQFYKVKVNASTVLRWIRKYVKMLDNYVSNFKPEVGDIWNSDEMTAFIRKKGEERYYEWIWNVMDADTRFLLASKITKKREINDAKKPLKKAKEISGKKPKAIITDGLQGYRDAIPSVFYKNTDSYQVQHYRVPTITHPINNNIVERLNGTVRERTKVMRGFDSRDTAQILLDGEKLYYNYIRPHTALDGLTPAQQSNINLPPDWMKLIELASNSRRATALRNATQLP